MRQDMHRLTAIRTLDIVGERKLASRGHVRDVESLPTHQSMRQSVPHYSYPRVAKDNAALRWLERQVGRVWNDVYAELRKHFDARSTQQGVALESLLGRVERRVHVDAGVPCVHGSDGNWTVNGLYVHPDTGVLQLHRTGDARKFKRERQQAQARGTAGRVDVSESLQLHFIEGQWYWVELAAVVPPKTCLTKPTVCRHTGQELVAARAFVDPTSVCQDVLSGDRYPEVPLGLYDVRQLANCYGREGVYGKRKWQASHRDIARHVRLAA